MKVLEDYRSIRRVYNRIGFEEKTIPQVRKEQERHRRNRTAMAGNYELRKLIKTAHAKVRKLSKHKQSIMHPIQREIELQNLITERDENTIMKDWGVSQAKQ